MAIGTGGKRKSQFNTVCQGQYGVKIKATVKVV